jgi:hypothetical protein
VRDEHGEERHAHSPVGIDHPLEDGRFAEGEAHVQAQRHQDRTRQERQAPGPRHELLVGERP